MRNSRLSDCLLHPPPLVWIYAEPLVWFRVFFALTWMPILSESQYPSAFCARDIKGVAKQCREGVDANSKVLLECAFSQIPRRYWRHGSA